jgi:hypothetical protein
MFLEVSLRLIVGASEGVFDSLDGSSRGGDRLVKRLLAKGTLFGGKLEGSAIEVVALGEEVLQKLMGFVAGLAEELEFVHGNGIGHKEGIVVEEGRGQKAKCSTEIAIVPSGVILRYAEGSCWK